MSVKSTTEGRIPCAPASENDFCEGCGLCCDGTLFRWAPLAPEEECLSAHGLQTLDREGEPRFDLPCPALKEGRCSIYPIRPKICRDFRCKLLRQYERGELEAGEGRLRVGAAKRLKAAALASDPDAAFDGKRQALWRSLSVELNLASSLEKKQLATRLLAIVSLETYIREWFREQKG